MEQKLNCWPGCLAIVTKSIHGNSGKVVRCIRLLDAGEELKTVDGRRVKIDTKQAEWLVDVEIKRGHTGDGFVFVKACSDKSLTPLRDDDGQDEMLRIAGLPNQGNADVKKATAREY